MNSLQWFVPVNQVHPNTSDTAKTTIRERRVYLMLCALLFIYYVSARLRELRSKYDTSIVLFNRWNRSPRIAQISHWSPFFFFFFFFPLIFLFFFTSTIRFITYSVFNLANFPTSHVFFNYVWLFSKTKLIVARIFK